MDGLDSTGGAASSGTQKGGEGAGSGATQMGVPPPQAPTMAPDAHPGNPVMDPALEARVVVGKFLRGCTCYDLIKDSSKVTHART